MKKKLVLAAVLLALFAAVIAYLVIANEKYRNALKPSGLRIKTEQTE